MNPKVWKWVHPIVEDPVRLYTSARVERENNTRANLVTVRADRAERLHRLKNRPLWRKAYDAIVYVLTEREP